MPGRTSHKTLESNMSDCDKLSEICSLWRRQYEMSTTDYSNGKKRERRRVYSMAAYARGRSISDGVFRLRQGKS